MKSPAIISENRFLGSIITSSSIRNLLPRSISAKHKPIQNPETKLLRSDDENSIPVDPNIQTDDHQFPSATKVEEAVSVLSTRTNSMPSEITEEDDDLLGDQIRELKEELIRTKSDGSKGSHFARDNLSQLRVSINKSLLMTCPKGDESEAKETDVVELNKHIEKLQASYDSLHSSFASASCREEEESISEGDKDLDFGEDDENVGFDTASSGISIKPCALEEPVFSESPKIKNVAASTKFLASSRNVSESSKVANTKVEQVSPSRSKKLSGPPTDSIAASLQRGLQVIDYHQRSSLSKSSSVSFSFGHLPLKPDNLHASVQSSRKDKPLEEGGSSSILLCLSCRKKVDQEAEVSEECGKANFDASEKEALLKEIAELKSKLQPTKSAENLRSSLLLRSIQMRRSIDVTKNAENSEVLKKEKEMWTEMESEWISLTDDLRMDIDNHRKRAEDLEIELKQEKLATEELNDALGRAVLGHSRFIEQYTELQEKYNELEEKHGVMMAGITDVKKAATKAAMNGRNGKRFAKAFSDELSAIRAEKEKEREMLKKENKSLRTQLRDTAEAVQAAGELLVRLKESEQALQDSEERFGVVEEEKERLNKQMEKLKSIHKTEMETMKQYLAESKLPSSALLQPWYKDVEEEEEEKVSEHQTKAVSFDEYEDDQAWRAEFGAIYQDHHY